MKLMITIKGDSLLIQLLDVVFWLFHVWSFWWWLPTSWISWKSQILCPILPVVYHFIWLSLPWLLLLLVLEEVSLFSKDWLIIHGVFCHFRKSILVWFTSTSLSIPIWHLSLSAIIWQYFLQLILQWSWNVIIFHLLVLLVKQSRLVRDHLGLHF